MGLYRPNAPPMRDGVGASCVVLPAGSWFTVAEFLLERFAHVPASEWAQRLATGAVIDEVGTALDHTSPYQPGQRVYYFRSLPAEPPIPFEAQILWQDEHLLVVDKPHFLPVLPSGKYVHETVLVRLKKSLDIDDLVPIHRIDRDTAGLVLFSVQRATRAAYHALFRDRQVIKTYQAIAPWNPELQWPIRRETRLEAGSHFMQQIEVAGIPNTLTHITPIEVQCSIARYQLKPVTGHRHQLRVHMAALGLPISGDRIYPNLTPEGTTDYAHPLQLLAQAIRFVDPLTGREPQFESVRSLLPLV
ncbi:MAG: pseudouridine synthase [Rhodoferax sp.]|nr:pseudouridine synthase [Rhodoferax sp.]